MNFLKITGKFLDQPILVAKFNKVVPAILIAGGATYCAYKAKNSSETDKKNIIIRDGITMGATVTTALIAPKIVNRVFKNQVRNIDTIKKDNQLLIDEFVSHTKLDEKSNKILEKAKEKILSYKEIKHIHEKLNSSKSGKEFINKLIPNPENVTSKDIFSEIGRLSLLGLIPVLGGILGGVAGDRITTPDWKESFPNKVKEGLYQYLANIFLCNIGAGIALGIMEKFGVKSKSGRAIGMISGILATGVIGGSVIANIISNRLINPLFGEKSCKKIFNERKPEAIDIGLHVDDIATVAVMSGLKWIEPALPIMYSISGYRAGIGYRNNIVNNCNKNNKS